MPRQFIENSFAAAYEKVLYALLHHPEHVTRPRGQKTHELENVLIEISDPTNNLFACPARPFPKRYLAGELMWYFGGRNDLDFISKYSTFWNDISNPNGTCNSAYGSLLFTRTNPYGISDWTWAREALKDDQDTRQAILRFNGPEHSYPGNRDFVCTLTGIFSIRNDQLDFTITMRSNDVFYGMTYDFPFFMLLQQQMRIHLLKYYPGLKLGKFTYFGKSVHMYERNFEVCKRMLNNITEDSLPRMTYSLITPCGLPTDELAEIISGNLENSIYMGQDLLYDWILKNGFTNE